MHNSLNIFMEVILPLVLLIVWTAAVSWMAVWVAKAGQPGYRFVVVVLKAAIVPAILRVGCLWSMFPGVASGYGTLDFLVSMIGMYPEVVLFPNALLVSPRENRWMVGGTLLLSLLLTLSVFVVTTICASIVFVVNRRGHGAESKRT